MSMASPHIGIRRLVMSRTREGRAPQSLIDEVVYRANQTTGTSFRKFGLALDQNATIVDVNNALAVCMQLKDTGSH